LCVLLVFYSTIGRCSLLVVFIRYNRVENYVMYNDHIYQGNEVIEITLLFFVISEVNEE